MALTITSTMLAPVIEQSQKAQPVSISAKGPHQKRWNDWIANDAKDED